MGTEHFTAPTSLYDLFHESELCLDDILTILQSLDDYNNSNILNMAAAAAAATPRPLVEDKSSSNDKNKKRKNSAKTLSSCTPAWAPMKIQTRIMQSSLKEAPPCSRRPTPKIAVAEMPPKKQFCRYYQRGSCQYGARCKFEHEIEQPSKPNNAFGFGVQAGTHQSSFVQQQSNPFGFGSQSGINSQSQSSQQQPNPFGFGSQSGVNSQSQQSRSSQQQPNPFGFGVKGSNPSSKPFENKWSRSSANHGTAAAASSRQAGRQAPPATHSCTDPDSCKRQIAEDFEHERPLWKLTCYGHQKCAPCDIIGDVSYEELRMSAYDDAKSGMNHPSIVEKERHLLNAKLVEFETLLRNPYKGPSSSATSQSPFPQATPIAFSSMTNSVASPSQSPFPQATPNAFSSTTNNVASHSAWTFGQPALSRSTGSGISATVSSNNAFKQSGMFQNSSQSASAFGTLNSPFGGLSSHSAQTAASPFGTNKPSFPSSFMSAPSSTTPFPSNSIISNSTIQIGTNPASHEMVQAVETSSFTNKTQPTDASVDDKIWLNEKWHPGECKALKHDLPEFAVPRGK
ncbi:unnamed protein product [Rhodiola kirilowii]